MHTLPLKYTLHLILMAFLTLSSLSHAKGKQIFIGEPSEPQCRTCHDDITAYPMLQKNNRDRHHQLINSTIPPLFQSKAPNAVGANNTGSPYQCLSCHVFRLDPATGERFIIEPFRNCLQCHPVSRVTGPPRRGNNVHHETQTFQQRQCFVCHTRGGMRGGRGGR